MPGRFEEDDKVQARENDEASWEEAEVREIDPSDDVRTYKIRFIDGGTTQWVKNENVRGLNFVTRLVQEETLSSLGRCPICNSPGMFSFNLFKCTNSRCQNNG